MHRPKVICHSIRSIGMIWFVFWQNLTLPLPIFAFPIAMKKIA